MLTNNWCLHNVLHWRAEAAYAFGGLAEDAAPYHRKDFVGLGAEQKKNAGSWLCIQDAPLSLFLSNSYRLLLFKIANLGIIPFMTSEIPFANLQERATEYLDRIKRESDERVRERREGRKEGALTRSLMDSLRNCNPKQLKAVKKLVREYEKDHKEPPDRREISTPGGTEVVHSQAHKNKLYTVELRSCGKANCTKCPHGPYVYVYQRDGSLFPSKSINETKFSRLPAEIRERFRTIRNEVRAEREKFFSLDRH